jgi:hypothetical protein
MESTQSEQTTQKAAEAVDSQDNAAKIGAIDELLGIEAEGQPAEPEKAKPTEPDTSLSEALAEAEKPPGDGESRKVAKPPKTLTELAERLEVEVKDLYAIEIPAAEDGGESHTLGSLKDEAAKQVDYAGRELALEERRVKLENDQVRARGELEVILSSLPPDAIKPDILKRAKAEREVFLDREAARVLDVIPEWENDQTKRDDLAGIGEHMAQYGFDKNHIDQVADHRMLRYMRDNFNRKRLVDKALAGVKPVKPIPQGTKRQPAKPAATVTATPESSLDEQLTAVDALLKK